jgi:curli biogenesis system outer membrane secretion channel CsgG
MSTNRFDVTDKKIAKNIFELYSTDVAKKIYVNGKNSSLPKVPGIRYFVLGSITDFTDGSESKGGGIGFGGVKVGGGKSIASITMHMRIIDSTTGSVIYSGRLDGVAESKKGGIDLSGLGVDANFSASSKTPLGQATQKLLDSATDAIIAATM